MLVNLKEVMLDAREKGYAVGAFNVPNLESVMAIIQAAEELGKGVILNYAEVHSSLLSIETAALIMLDFAKKASVPVCVHLDHGSSVESCMKAMRLGFTSVMIDASDSDYEENVRQTAEVVRLAHCIGVTVEAELGHIFASEAGLGEGKSETKSAGSFESLDDVYTDPDTAKDFVERTGIDALAIAFGTTHGIYKKKPVLDLERIAQIRGKIEIPFVMHGGSGLCRDEFQKAINNGIRKINYYTYMALAGGRAVKNALDKYGKEDNIFFHDIPLIGIAGMREDVKKAIRIFSLES